MSGTRLTIDVEGKPCPFCGGSPEFKEIPYTGMGASGMEIPEVTIGCRNCDVWLPRMPGEKWIQNRGTYSVTTESKLTLLTRWNTRAEAKA